jgi:formylglycine-generating enzyme required for sulfatase activity
VPLSASKCKVFQETADYGETVELLPHYGWCNKNSAEQAWPVGIKKPNDLGLFDMTGNVYSWCQEAYGAYPTVKDGEPIEDKKGVYSINTQINRVLRGGSFLNPHASYVRCADRIQNGPTHRNYDYGFRLARTYRRAASLLYHLWEKVVSFETLPRSTNKRRTECPHQIRA